MNEVYHTTERLLFEDIGGKKLEVDFDGGEVSSDAGILFLREVERRMKLLVPDIDDTEDVTLGHQKLAFFNAFFD